MVLNNRMSGVLDQGYNIVPLMHAYICRYKCCSVDEIKGEGISWEA